MHTSEQQYLDVLQRILDTGIDRMDRTGVGTRSIFGAQMRFDLSKGFPLFTTKKVHFRSIVHELIWFLSGDTNISYLVRNNVKIWNEWAFSAYIQANNLNEKWPRYSEKWHEELAIFVEKIKNDDDFAQKWGDLGPIYGKQWRAWDTKSGNIIDQMQNAINTIKNDPYSRRNLVSGWNVGEIETLIKDKNTAPPPCHTLFQFYVANNKLSCQLYQRSADMFLGVPFNVASYALLTMLIAQSTELEVGDFVHTFGDAHIYHNHFDQVKEQLSRELKPLPTVRIVSQKSLFDYTFDDIILENYDSHPSISAPIAV